MMKNILLVSALALFIINITFEVNAAISTTRVLDVDGKKLQTNASYYILPVMRGMGGGLTLAARKPYACPLYVAQELQEVSKGLPLKFHPVDPKEKSIMLSADMNFVFSGATTCVQSLGWKLGGVDGVTGKRYVTSGGALGNPGPSTVSNWFKIDKYRETDYKLVFCPSVCNFCKVVCGDVGVFIEDGRRWLGLSDVPFPVMFKKA